jgi:hypothetical protein
VIRGLPSYSRCADCSTVEDGRTDHPPVLASNAWQAIWLFDVPQAAFLGVAVATATVAVDVRSARAAVCWLAVWATAALIIGHLGRSRTFSRRAGYAAIASAAALGLYFVTQFSYLAVPDKIGALEAAGRLVSNCAPRLAVWAPFPNSLATLLEGFVLLAVGAALDARTAAGRTLLTAETAVVGFACALTMSRGAWLGVAVAGIVWTLVAVIPRSKRPLVVAAVLLAIPAIGLAMTWEAGLHLVTHAAALGGGTFVRPDRIDIYRKSVALLNDVGLIGLGPGEQFAAPFSRFALVIQVPFVTYPHQLTFHLWLAYGIAGIVVWAWWLGAIAAAVAVAERQRVSQTFRGTWCGLVAVLVHGLSDARQAVDPWTWGPFFVLTALIAARHRRAGRALPLWGVAIPGATVTVALLIGLLRLWPLGAAWHTSQGILQETRVPVAGTEAAADDLIESAEREYERAILVDPHSVGARRRLALLAADRGEFAAAFDHAADALRSDPDGYTTKKVAGLVAAWTGQLDAACALLSGMPGVGDELRTWASAWRDRGRPEVSENALLTASRLAGIQ